MCDGLQSRTLVNVRKIVMQKKSRLSYYFSLFFLLPSSLCAQDLKVLVLVIASDQLPVYTKLQERWRSYMHYDPDHVSVYFLKSDPTLSTNTHINGDIIWAKTDDGWAPHSAGIANKTILAFEAMLPRLDEFDFVVRTNLSSFYHFPRLLTFLDSLPKLKCYSGFTAYAKGTTFCSGAGFILSCDLVRAIVAQKHLLMDHKTIEDDIIFGTFITKGLQVAPIHHERFGIQSLGRWFKVKDAIPEKVFHFRLKNDDDSRRMSDELYIYDQLIATFYTDKGLL